jgi:hypothetical protein
MIETFIKKHSVKIALAICGAVFFLGIVLTIFFRAPHTDETLYLRETVVMSESIRNGEWFGNYGVGVHGFLFKLPVALIFLLTGPSVFVATLFHVLLASISCYLVYRISKYHIGMTGFWPVATMILFASGHQFLTTFATYFREAPVVFMVLVLIDATLSKKNYWIIGIILMILLDAKEHVFFSIVPGYGLWMIYDQFFVKKEKRQIISFSFIRETFTRFTAVFLPSAVFLILMFTTALIPINMFNAYILQLTSWGELQVSVETATENTQGETGKQITRISKPNVALDESSPLQFLNPVIDVTNATLSYVGKIFYPRTFGLLSTPLIFTVPAVIMSIYMFRKWRKSNKNVLLLLPFLLWMYILTYMLHRGHGRYLFPISPVIMIFFVTFLSEKLKVKTSQSIFLDVVICVIISLFFESNFIGPKIALHAMMLTALGLYLYIKYVKKSLIPIASIIAVVVFSLATASVGLAYMMSVQQRGQIIKPLIWGYSMEADNVVSLVDNSDVIWINNIDWSVLPHFYRQDVGTEPEWYWRLKSFVPKKHMLGQLEKKKTFSENWETEEELQMMVKQNNIERLIFVESEFNDFEFMNEYDINTIRQYDWLSFVSSHNMQNKTAYLFDVN